MTYPLPPCRPADNPFRSECVDSLPFRPRGWSWQELEERLESTRWRGAVVGPEGSGKTALLEELAARSRNEAAIVRLRRDTPRPTTAAREQLPQRLGTQHTVLFDGAEQLGPIGWWRFCRAAGTAGGLIITGHSPGRLPTLVECTSSLGLLRELVADLSPDDAESLEPILGNLFDRHHGNIRGCFRDLYDLYAGRSPRIQS